jgi:uncharacterized protein (DUF302 family)
MRYPIFVIGLLFLSVSVVTAGSGMVNIKSAYDVTTTADRLEAALNKKGMTLFTRINHSDGAMDVGMQLRPTELIIFGNPKVGTPLMQCNQGAAIDLPQKALVWQDEKGQVWLSYNDPAYLVGRHNITGCTEVLKKISAALMDFSRVATSR